MTKNLNSQNIKINDHQITQVKFTNFQKKNQIDIVFKNISYSVEVPDDNPQLQSKIPGKKAYKKKQILKNISGVFKAGQCSAIMGASGAGKTTLLNILSCRIQHDEGGNLYANNLQYNFHNFGNFANYVMQSDVLMQTLTVRETLQFAAKLKLNLSEEDRKERVIEIANQFKLQKCLDTLVGGVILKGISGGQKKRTSIAFQLISDPQVVFLDQPTSGLDSLTSYIIVSQLRKLARKFNKTVVMTIHQPNSQTYALFDNLTLLLEGKIIYQNNAQNVALYFQKQFNLTCPQFINPPDFIMAKIHHEDQKNVEFYPKYFSTYQQIEQKRILKLMDQKNTAQVELRSLSVSFFTQISAILKRNLLNVMRNPMLIRSKIMQGIFLALFVGGLFFDIGTRDYTSTKYWYSIIGFLFFSTIAGTMTSLAPVTLTFPLEREVFFKQQDSKMYNVATYFLARNIVQMPQLIIVPLIVTSIYYFMIDLAGSAQQFFIHCLIYFLMAFAGAAVGLFIGTIILDSKSVSVVTPVIMLPLFLFSGFFKNRKQLPDWIGWIQYISPLKYGFTAFVKNQTSQKASLVNTLNFDVQMWEAIGILFALGIGFRLISLFFLWYLRKRTQ